MAQTQEKRRLTTKGLSKNIFGNGFYVDVGETDQIKFGEVCVPPQSKAGYDAGHPDADEVFYVAEGEVNIYFPDSEENETVKRGEYILMPRSLAHEIHNIGKEECKVLFFGAVR